MAVVGDGDSVDCVAGIALGDFAVAMQRARAFVADTGDSNAGDSEMRGFDLYDLAAMASGVVQTDYVGHDCLAGSW